MPRYQKDPSKVSFGFPIVPKGRYVVELSNAKSFYKKATKAGKEDNFGVRFGAKVVLSDDRPDWVGKNFGAVTCYQHSEGGEAYTKSIQAAALGAHNDEEFNDQFAGLDWSFNTDDQSVGEAWHQMEGQLIVIDCDEPNDPQDTGTLQTNVKSISVKD